MVSAIRARHPLCASLLLAFILVGLSSPAAAQKRTPRGEESQTAGPKAGKDDPARRALWFMRGRLVRGESSALLLQRAYRQRERMRQQRLLQRQETGTSRSTSAAGSEGGAPGALSTPAWEPLGPTIINGMGRFGDASGRVTAVAIDQNDSTGNTVYVGGAYGGVWKTTNGKATPSAVVWTPLFDTAPAATTLAMGAISIQPTNSNVILAGTGEAHNALDSYYGQGILRSTDGGATWTMISTADSGARPFRGLGITRFAWSTTDPNFVVAAASYTPLGSITNAGPLVGAANGLYWSEDAGATWNYSLSVKDGATNTSVHRVTDVVYNATLGKFFAAMRYHGLYESTDGKNWTRMANQPDGSAAATTLSAANCPAATSTNCPFYRGQLAVRPGSAEMYVVWVTSSNPDNIGALSRTLDGTTWTRLTISGINSCGDSVGCGASQGFYNLYITAVPNGTSTDVYFGAVNLFKCIVPSTGTTNLCTAVSGTNNRWLNITKVYGHFTNSQCTGWQTIHPDQHAMDFLLGDPTVAYFGNDGGVYRTLNSRGLVNNLCTQAANPFDDLNNNTLGSLTQFMAFSMHPTDDDVLLGGTQDNGSPGMSISDGQTTGLEWFEAWGGDGGYNEIDRTNPQNWYVTNTGVSIHKCTTGKNCITFDPFTQIVGSSQVGGDTGPFYTPWLLDPADQSKLIVGTCRVWRGPNTSTGWPASPLSPNFETGGAGGCTGNDVNEVRSLAAGGPVVNGVSDVLYAGTDGFSGSTGGRIWVTTNADGGSATWADRTGTINPGGFPISSIAIDAADATGQTAYITIMGFTGNPNGAGHVFKTTNAGVTWTDVGTGLPDSPADAVAIDPRDPNVLYVATDVGVFVTRNGGTSWEEYGTGLPNVAPLAMRIFNAPAKTPKLRIATHGRGVWQIDLAPLFGPVQSVTLTPSPASPQAPGTGITFTADAVGDSGSYEYRFYKYVAGAWTIVQEYSTDNTWDWNTGSEAAGTHYFTVYARNVGSTAAYEATKFGSFALQPLTPVSSVTLTPSPASPRAPGTAVTFTAAAAGGSGSYEYRFYKYIGGVWTIVQNYSTDNTWEWSTGSEALGTHHFTVYARNVGSTAPSEATKFVSYTLANPASSVTLTPSPASPQAPGTAVTFTAAAAGGSGSYEYRFYKHIGGVWTIVQNYSTDNTWEWSTGSEALGAHYFTVYARNVGSTAASEATKFASYTLTNPVSSVALTPSPAGPQPVGTPVTLTAAATGGSGNYEYRFYKYVGGAWVIVQPYSATATYDWSTSGEAAGTHYFTVYARNAGSTAPYEATKFLSYTLQ